MGTGHQATHTTAPPSTPNVVPSFEARSNDFSMLSIKSVEVMGFEQPAHLPQYFPFNSCRLTVRVIRGQRQQLQGQPIQYLHTYTAWTLLKSVANFEQVQFAFIQKHELAL